MRVEFYCGAYVNAHSEDECTKEWVEDREPEEGGEPGEALEFSSECPRCGCDAVARLPALDDLGFDGDLDQMNGRQ